MGKYAFQVTEEAYELSRILDLPDREVVRRMRQKHPTFCWRTLTKWKKDKELNWDERYKEYCKGIAKRTDAELVKKITPIVNTVQDVRDKVYEQLKNFLKTNNTVVNEKNLGLVLSSFTKLLDLENKITGSGQAATPIKQVVYVILMAIEKNPAVGPVFKAHKKEIIDAVFEEIEDGK